MSRTLRLVVSQKIYKTSWDYPSSRDYCTYCGHRHCIDPISINGNKSKGKAKGTHRQKLYSNDLIASDDEDDG